MITQHIIFFQDNKTSEISFVVYNFTAFFFSYKKSSHYALTETFHQKYLLKKKSLKKVKCKLNIKVCENSKARVLLKMGLCIFE